MTQTCGAILALMLMGKYKSIAVSIVALIATVAWKACLSLNARADATRMCAKTARTPKMQLSKFAEFVLCVLNAAAPR